MSENMYTQEPWDTSLDDDQWPVVMASGKIVANVNPESFFAGVADLVEMPAYANARRIVACVNACAGIDTDYLEKYGLPDFAQKISDIAQQRDTLLAACETFMSHGVCEVSYYAIRDAIAAAKPKDNESNKEAA